MSSASHILSTKLRPPTRLAGMIDRPRLSEPLVGDLPKVALVVAAAGFGKTTFIAQCHQRLGAKAVWLSLDRNDQDPFTFVRHLIAGFNRACPIIASATQSFVEGRAGALDVDDITVRIANDLERFDEPRVLLVDDYYLAETPEINAFVGQLIERSPAQLHVVIASRVQPDLPIARYKAGNLLREFGVRDLTFDRDEAAAFLHRAHGLTLAAPELDVLVRRTEGWGAGLQLASLFLKTSENPRDAIHGLSGDSRDLADYLATEVVRSQSAAIRHFLLHTSILDRMNAGVCNALLERDDAQTMLERVEKLGLFLVPLDARRGWYRYHHLFRDFLRAQLRREQPAAVATLYRRASTWFADAGLQEEAVNMAMDANDFDHAAALLERFAIDMVKQGHIPQIARWIQRFPAKVLEQNPRLPLYQCWAAAHMGQVQQAEQLLQRVEANLTAICGNADTARVLVEAEIHTLRTIVAMMSDDIDNAYTMAQVALPDGPEFAFFAGCLANVAGLTSLARGEFAQAMDATDRAARLHARSGCSYGICYSRCTAGLTHFAQGRLSSARQCFSGAIADAVRHSGERSFNAAMPRVLLALLLYETNALDEAYAILEGDLPLVDECAYVDMRTGAFLAMAGVLGARGQVNAALAYLDHAVTINVETAFDRTCVPVNAESIRLRLIAGDVAGARRFARHTGIEDAIALPTTWSRPAGLRAISQCRLLIAEGHADATLGPLHELANLTRRSERSIRNIQILSLLIVAQVQTHQQEAAFATARRILALGAEEGLLRSILDQGPAAGETFLAFARERANTALLSPIEADYLARICAAVTTQAPGPASTPFSVDATVPIVVNGIAETLTERELNVLRLIAKGAPNTQIGATLFISVNTVRWHVANILSKLQVENRTQAAAAARALGLAT